MQSVHRSACPESHVTLAQVYECAVSRPCVLQGRFVLEDGQLKWLAALQPARSEAAGTAASADPAARAATAARKVVTELYIALGSACIKGALSHLNLPCNVVGNADSAPACATHQQLHACADQMQYTKTRCLQCIRLQRAHALFSTAYVCDCVRSRHCSAGSFTVDMHAAPP